MGGKEWREGRGFKISPESGTDGGGLEYPQKVVEMGGLEYPQTTGKLYNRRGRGEGEGIDKCNQESMIISNIASE